MCGFMFLRHASLLLHEWAASTRPYINFLVILTANVPLWLQMSTTSVSSYPPQNVAKTVFRAFTNEQKSLTLTLYHKHKSSAGTLLVQGNGCPGWADEEFPMSETLVQTMLTSPSIPWQTQLQDILFHFCPTTDAVDAASTNPVDPT